MPKLNDLLMQMAGEIPGVIAVAVAGMDGLPLVHYNTKSSLNVEVASAQFALVMKLVQKTCTQLGEDVVEDNLVTTDETYLLTLFIGEGTYYLVIAANKKNSSLGNVRLIARQYADSIYDQIPKMK